MIFKQKKSNDSQNWELRIAFKYFIQMVDGLLFIVLKNNFQFYLKLSLGSNHSTLK